MKITKREVMDYLTRCETYHRQQHKKNFTRLPPDRYEVEYRGKWAIIYCIGPVGGKRQHTWINADTGTLHRPSGNKPGRWIRGNIRDSSKGMRFVDPWGLGIGPVSLEAIK